MLVYVLNKNGKPLMPCKPAKARKLLKAGKATVVRRNPFTIKLNWDCENHVQPVTLGVDAGYKTVGVSAVSNKKELFATEVKLRIDVSKKITERRMYRRMRRSKLWYRKPRFLNRKRSEEWLAPSVQHRLDSHLKVIMFVSLILPISKITIETAKFDIQRIKNPTISGTEYQNGEQKDFWNVRTYVIYRDNHQCQYCKKTNIPLNVHHIKSRKDGGTDKPDNLITLCEECHQLYHKGKIALKINYSKEFKAETFMSMIRWRIFNILKSLYSDVSYTYGYLTKCKRIELSLDKSHVNDAFVIAGGEKQSRIEVLNSYFSRRNNRALQLNRKGFKPSIRKQKYQYQPDDIVKYNNIVCRVKGVFSKGRYVRLVDRFENIVNVNINKVRLIHYGKGLQFI
jgi:hypothetical protein